MKDFGIFYGPLIYFTTILYILWTFGIFCGNLAYFPGLICCIKKNLATLLDNRGQFFSLRGSGIPFSIGFCHRQEAKLR
jgi:hypothetical protein